MVLFVSGSFPYAPDGISDSAKLLLDALILHAGKDCFLLYTTEREDIKKCLNDNGSINYVFAPNWKLNFANINRYWQILKTSPAISVVHMEYPGTYYGKTFMATAIPFITRIFNLFHRTSIKIHVRLHEFTDARLLRKIAILPIALFAHKLYVPALKDRNAISRFVGRKKVKPTIIGNNISINSNCIRKRSEKKTISYFGAVYPGKGIDKMLDLWHELKQRDAANEYQFKIIGDLGIENDNKFRDYHIHVLEKIKDKGLTEHVEITGYVSDTKASEEIQNSDVATLYFNDGLTLRRCSFLAFLAHGIPIVTSSGDEEATKLFCGHDGIFMNDSIDACADYIVKLLASEQDRFDKIKADNAETAKHFDWNNIAQTFLAEYGSVE